MAESANSMPNVPEDLQGGKTDKVGLKCLLNFHSVLTAKKVKAKAVSQYLKRF